MSRRAYALDIERWEEGPEFRPFLGRKPQASRLTADEPFEPSEEGGMLSRSVKPVGFYIAYSYTLFRKKDARRDSLYAFF
jgi:hypothetical protein